jgi:putative ABC transport system permease protein
MPLRDVKPPRLFEMLLSRFLLIEEREEKLGDFNETHRVLVRRRGRILAGVWYFLQIFRATPSFIDNILYWRTIMFRNYLKVTFRNLLRHKAYSALNILGLAVGLTCCLFILLYIRFELSYDSHHLDSDRIYLVGVHRSSEARIETTVSNFPNLIPVLKERYPQVEAGARINGGRILTVKYKDKTFKEEGLLHVNPDIFNVLTIPFMKGSPAEALVRPNTAVLSQTMADKYFGNEDPMGKMMRIAERDYEITGVLKDPPLNTGVKYNILMSWKTIENDEFMQDWHAGILPSICLIKLREGVSAAAFESQIRRISYDFVAQELEERGLEFNMFLVPMILWHRNWRRGDWNSICFLSH